MSSNRSYPLLLFISLVLVGSCVSDTINVRRSRRGVDITDSDMSSSSLETQDDPRGYTAADWDLLSQLVARRKRQWCPKGKTYNYVLGYCMYSYSALRNRGKLI